MTPMKNKTPKGFREQLIECNVLGFYKKTKLTPLSLGMLPISPKKRKKLLDANIKTLEFRVCSRFGGICSSEHKGCQKLRGVI